ncbi:hypothetical protein YSY43_01250 [Paenibacillus sp. YSY-4.3]
MPFFCYKYCEEGVLIGPFPPLGINHFDIACFFIGYWNSDREPERWEWAAEASSIK